MPETSAEPVFDTAWVELRDPESGHYRSGTAVMIHGAAISPEVIEAAVLDQLGDGWERLVTEVQHLAYHRRIKRCSNLDGWGCDMEGEWHSHWSPVRHNDASPNCCHTVALPVWRTR